MLVGAPKPGAASQQTPRVPAWDAERAAAVAWEGLPPLGAKTAVAGKVVLRNVAEVWVRGEEGVHQRWAAPPGERPGTVVLAHGAIACVGAQGWCLDGADTGAVDAELDLAGGAVGPGLMTFGSPLGVEEIAQELSTGDGLLFDAYVADTPAILHDTGAVVRAADALQFGTRNAL